MSLSPTTLGNLAKLTQLRLEENPLGSNPSSQFWDFNNELMPLVVEALNLATLISGDPQLVLTGTSLLPNQTLQPMPPGLVAITRVEVAPGPGLPSSKPLRKTTVWTLDRMTPGWQRFVPPAALTLSEVSGGQIPSTTYYAYATYAFPNQEGPISPVASFTSSGSTLLQVASPARSSGAIGWNLYLDRSLVQFGPPQPTGNPVRINTAVLPFDTPFTMPIGGISFVGVSAPRSQFPRYWFPVGMTQWGITPQVSAATPITVAGIALPVPVARPYTGAETIMMQEEYADAVADCAAIWARLKEGTEDFFGGMQLFDDFMGKMAELSKFSIRKSQLLFSRALGAEVKLTDVEKKGLS